MTADPFRLYRERDPVHRHAPSDAWLVTRYDDVMALLVDPRLTSQTLGDRIDTLPSLATEERAELTAFYGGWLSLVDGSVHRRLRRFVAPILAPSAVMPWAPVLEAFADDQARSADRADIRDSFAGPYAARVVAGVLGLSPAEFREVLRATGQLLRPVGAGDPSPVQARQAHAALALVAAAERRLVERAVPVGTPAPLLAGRELPEELRGATLVQLVAGGYDPLARCLESYASAGRLQAPDGATTVAGDGDVDEVLRLHPPFQLLPRTAVEPVAVGEHVLPRGAKVLLAIGSANHDTTRERTSSPVAGERAPSHVSFGAGRHRCPAATLARLAVGAGVRALRRRWPEGSPQ